MGRQRLGKDCICLTSKGHHWALFRGPDCKWAWAEAGGVGFLVSQFWEVKVWKETTSRIWTCTWGFVGISNVKLKEWEGIEFRSKERERGLQPCNGQTGCWVMQLSDICQAVLAVVYSGLFLLLARNKQKNNKQKNNRIPCCWWWYCYVGSVGSLLEAENKSTKE